MVIREGDRSIIRDGGGRAIIRHNEASRFAINARNVQVERQGANTQTIIERPNGVRIVNITAADGHLVRRVRRDRGGHEIIIIDNSYGGPRASTVFIDLPPPVIRIPRDRYIVEADRASPENIYAAFLAPPVEVLLERYTLDQVRFSEPLRERMPRVDLNITFDTGSWQLSPDQVDRLAAIADGLNRAMERNPREVFMIEGHTDAVGNDDDNLSLSDRFDRRPSKRRMGPAHQALLGALGFASFEPFHKFDSTVDTLQRRTRKSSSSFFSRASY